MTFGITGASGQLATAVLRYLLAHDGDADVVAVTRNPVRVEGLFKHRLTVRAGGFEDEAGLTRALAGVHRLLLIPGSDLVPGVRARQHRAAIRAAAAASLLETSGHDGVTYHATGPVSVTYAQLARGLSEAASSAPAARGRSISSAATSSG